ncbi:MAG: hypothetical protein R2786_08175 [Flavobacteriaceae bacterium]
MTNTSFLNRNSFKISIAVLLLTLLASCKTLNRKVTYPQMVSNASDQAQKLVNNSDYSTCEFGVEKRFGEILLKNNLWGRRKLNSPDSIELCSFKKGDYYGWKWQLPNNARGVIGYPALQVGNNPFSKKEKNPDFPIKLTEMSKLTVNYDVETHVKFKKYNLAFDLWLVNKEQQYNNTNITTEIMIWEDYFNFTSFGKKKESIITPFGVYDVLVGHLLNPKFNQDWTYVAFVRKTPRSKGEVDIAFFMDYLVKNKIVSVEDYFTSIEFGNEIGNSSGITLVKEFNWNLVRKNLN